MPKLLVYGTLMTGHSRHFYLAGDGARCLGNARTAARFALFQPPGADYPCMVKFAEQGMAVEGELWEVPDASIPMLDKVEGVPALYQRRVITLEDGQEVQAYLMPERPPF